MSHYITDAKDGINLHIEISEGVYIVVYMDDKTAQEMVGIIQNKLNARL